MNKPLASWTSRNVLAAAMITGVLATAQALPVYDTTAALAGSRSIGSGLVNAGGNATAASIDWTIGYDNGSGLWHYSYTFSENSAQGISHFVLDLSDNCSSTSRCVINFSDSGTNVDNLVYGTYTNANGNPNFTGSIVGVKFDGLVSANPYSFEFDSERAPVWGDFYSKGGNGGSNGFAIFNVGAADHNSSLTVDFIARPDTVTGPQGEGDPVPEPGTLLLLGLGLTGLAVGKRRRA